MRVPRLTEKEIAEQLARLPEWTRAGGVISRTYTFPGFVQAIAFVNQVAEAAETADHHPDIDVRFRRVMLALMTHDSGGLTRRDFELAAACDALAGEGEQ